jgi:hypothetical protein
MHPVLKPLTVCVLSALYALPSQAQTSAEAPVQTVVISASADASAGGLSKTFAGCSWPPSAPTIAGAASASRPIWAGRTAG